jgi:acetyl esterase
MALDPIMKAFLDQLSLQPGPKMHELPASAARMMFAAIMEMTGPKDVPIGKVANLVCPGPGGDIPLRIYTPVAPAAEALPALLFFHGGGFVIGNIDTHDGLCRMIANEAGVRVIAVDYRLAPEHKYPAAIEDAYAALSFVEANASELGVDANRIAVGGDSAGGQMTAVLTQMTKAKGGPSIAFQLLFFPVTQIGEETSSLNNFGEGYVLERAGLEWFYKSYVPADADRKDPGLSPLYASSFEGLPPAYLTVAEFDPLHDEGLEYGRKLKAAGVPCEIVDYPGLVHDFIYFQSVLPQAAVALKAAAQALKKGLKAG